MKQPLNIPENLLTQAINTAFNLNIDKLDFIPIGEASWLYKAASLSGEFYAVKFQKNVDAAPAEIIAQLTENKYHWIPGYMLTNESMLWAKEHDYYFSVQQFIESDEVNHASSHLKSEHLWELGTALAELHGQKLDKSKLPNVSFEFYKPSEILKAQQLIAAVHCSGVENKNQTAVEKVLSDQVDNINQLFENYLVYGNKLKFTQNDLNVVHGDMHFGNILKPAHDHLYIIDWDHTMHSVPEMDIMYCTDEQILEISNGYGRNLLENKVAIQYFRNYLLVRALIFYLSKLLDSSFADKASTESMIDIFCASPYLKRALISIE